MLITVAYADDEKSGNKLESNFSNNVVIDYNEQQFNLSLTGLTIRKKFFLKIYSMAHYIEMNPDVSTNETSDKEIYNTILQHNGAKQISMKFMRSLTADQIKDSLLSGIVKNSDEAQFQQILPDVERFNRAISADVKENDEFVLRWLPDGTLVSLFQGQEISTIKNENFARILWSIWFSKDSVVDRKSLIEKLLTSS